MPPSLQHGLHVFFVYFRQARSAVFRASFASRVHGRPPPVVSHSARALAYAACTSSTQPLCTTRQPCVHSRRAPARATAGRQNSTPQAVSYTHLRAHETPEHLVCRLL